MSGVARAARCYEVSFLSIEMQRTKYKTKRQFNDIKTLDLSGVFQALFKANDYFQSDSIDLKSPQTPARDFRIHRRLPLNKCQFAVLGAPSNSEVHNLPSSVNRSLGGLFDAGEEMP